MAGGLDIRSHRRDEQCPFWSFHLDDWSGIIRLVLLGSNVSAIAFFCDYSSLHIHCFVFRPLFIRNYLSVSNTPAEYTAVFLFNMLTIFLFVLVFVYEFFCALRRRVVAFRSGESQAMQLQPRWFSVYRYEIHHARLMAGVSRQRVTQNQALESSCRYSFVKSLYTEGCCLECSSSSTNYDESIDTFS